MRYRARTPGFAPRPLVPGLTWVNWVPRSRPLGGNRNSANAARVYAGPDARVSRCMISPRSVGLPPERVATLLDRPAPAGILRAMRTYVANAQDRERNWLVV